MTLTYLLFQSSSGRPGIAWVPSKNNMVFLPPEIKVLSLPPYFPLPSYLSTSFLTLSLLFRVQRVRVKHGDYAL
jgi:hypothetical protein